MVQAQWVDLDEGLHCEGVEGRGEVDVGDVGARVGNEEPAERRGLWNMEQDPVCRGQAHAVPWAGAADRLSVLHISAEAVGAAVRKRLTLASPEEVALARCEARLAGRRPWIRALAGVRNRPDNDGAEEELPAAAAAAALQAVGSASAAQESR